MEDQLVERVVQLANELGGFLNQTPRSFAKESRAALQGQGSYFDNLISEWSMTFRRLQTVVVKFRIGDASLVSIGLNRFAIKAFHSNGITTLAEVMAMSIAEIALLPRVGIVAQDELITKLIRNDYLPKRVTVQQLKRDHPSEILLNASTSIKKKRRLRSTISPI